MVAPKGAQANLRVTGGGKGAAGGTGVVLATRSPAAEVAPESVLQFSLARPIRLSR